MRCRSSFVGPRNLSLRGIHLRGQCRRAAAGGALPAGAALPAGRKPLRWRRRELSAVPNCTRRAAARRAGAGVSLAGGAAAAALGALAARSSSFWPRRAKAPARPDRRSRARRSSVVPARTWRPSRQAPDQPTQSTKAPPASEVGRQALRPLARPLLLRCPLPRPDAAAFFVPATSVRGRCLRRKETCCLVSAFVSAYGLASGGWPRLGPGVWLAALFGRYSAARRRCRFAGIGRQHWLERFADRLVLGQSVAGERGRKRKRRPLR